MLKRVILSFNISSRTSLRRRLPRGATTIVDRRSRGSPQRLGIGQTRASGKRDAQASTSAVGLLRRHLIPYSRCGVRDTAHRVHGARVHTRTHSCGSARAHTQQANRRAHTVTRGYVTGDDEHTRTSAPFRSIPFEPRLNSHRFGSPAALSTLRCLHRAALCLVARARSLCPCVRAPARAHIDAPPTSSDRGDRLPAHLRGLECLFLSETSPRTGYRRDTVPARARARTHGRELLGIIEN